jgi:hypothetical protein
VGLEHTPERILFFTDIWGEAWAAQQAGVHAVLMGRTDAHRSREKGSSALAPNSPALLRSLPVSLSASASLLSSPLFLSPSDRPGNYALPAEQQDQYTFPLAKDFFEVQAMMDQKAEGKGALQQLQQEEKKAEEAPKQEESQSPVDTSSGQYNTF